MSNVFRFSMSPDSEKLVDMNVVEEVVRLSQNAAQVGKQLESELDTQDGLKKFIRSQIEATACDGQTRHVQIIDEDALADLVIEKGLEHVEVKCEHYLGKDNWNFFKDSAVVFINSERLNFDDVKAQALAHGIKKAESTLSGAVHFEELAELMRVESKITGNPAAVFFPHAYDKAQAIKLVQLNGVVSATAWAKVGGAVAVGSNFVDVLTGEKTIAEAAQDMATSAAREILIDYAKSTVIHTAVGQPILQATMKYGGKTLLKTIGNAGVGATGLAINTVGQVGATAAGFASTIGLTGTAGAITAGTAGLTGAIGTAAALVTPLAPIALGGAAIYGVSKLLKKIF